MKNLSLIMLTAATLAACSHAPKTQPEQLTGTNINTVDRSIASSTDLNNRLYQSINEYRRTYSLPEITTEQFRESMVNNAEACSVLNSCGSQAENSAYRFRRIVKTRIPGAKVQNTHFIKMFTDEKDNSLTDLSNFLGSNTEK